MEKTVLMLNTILNINVALQVPNLEHQLFPSIWLLNKNVPTTKCSHKIEARALILYRKAKYVHRSVHQKLKCSTPMKKIADALKLKRLIQVFN